MNPNLDILWPYPFFRLKKLLHGIKPAAKAHISLAIGEPKNPTPDFIQEELINNISETSAYPATQGIPKLRQAIADWLISRFKIPASALAVDKNILPVNGTREALFALAQAAIDKNAKNPLVILPNPFYQIYEGATLLAGATPKFINLVPDNNFKADFSNIEKAEWDECQLLYICSPNNPTGSVLELGVLQKLIALSLKHNFIIAADECYSEIYPDEDNPPPGLLQAAIKMGHRDFKNCVVFHSLSKRSNCPGLRSGFIAGDAKILEKFLLYRTYHGCAMPLHHQHASAAAWADEAHVEENRHQYREKFTAVLEILQNQLDIGAPDAGFYLWVKVAGSDTEFARKLYAEENLSVLPGSFLARETNGYNPGNKYIRIALVPTLEECIEAARRISNIL